MNVQLHADDASLVPTNMRLLVVATGCFTAFAGSLAMGIIFSIYASVMRVGPILQPHFPKLGRGPMLAGALLPSARVLPYGVLVILPRLTIREPLLFALALASALLVAFCDVVLLLDEVRISRGVTPDKSD
jgi:hypothetical protein